jgi:hypothetical protein
MIAKHTPYELHYRGVQPLKFMISRNPILWQLQISIDEIAPIWESIQKLNYKRVTEQQQQIINEHKDAIKQYTKLVDAYVNYAPHIRRQLLDEMYATRKTVATSQNAGSMLAHNKMTNPHQTHKVVVHRAAPDSPHYAYYHCVDCNKFITWIDQATYSKESTKQKKVGVMWFGKHQGLPLTQVPQDYLEWCIRTIDQKHRNYKLLEQEYLRRQQAQ